jgi:hypothetical protein
MNRERLKYRKFLREMSYLAGAVGFVLVMFDWLLWRLMFPGGPWWLRIAGDVAGVALFGAAVKLGQHTKTLGRRETGNSAGS